MYSNSGELLLSAPVAALVVRGLRHFLNLLIRLPRWQWVLRGIWVPGVLLFMLDRVLRLRQPMLDDAYWLFVLMVVVLTVLTAVRAYRPARTLLLATVPFVLYKVLEFVIQDSSGKVPTRYNAVMDTP